MYEKGLEVFWTGGVFFGINRFWKKIVFSWMSFYAFSISYFLTVARLDVSPSPNPRGELSSRARANYRPSSLKWARTTLSIPVLTSSALHALVSLKPTLGTFGDRMHQVTVGM